jgi:uncharacterized protein (TIGR00106 family)
MIANISIFPIGKGASLSEFVAEAVDEADKSGLDYRLTAMGTIVEGEWDAVMKLVKKMRERLLKRSERIYLTIAIDERKDERRRLEAKAKNVENILSKNLRK